MTDFQRRVYEAVSRIPVGRVTTYQDLARALRCASPRAVGQALKHNPYAPKIPCHRVIASDLSPGGYQGQRGGPSLQHKLSLLRNEGVRFQSGKLADPAQLFCMDAG